MILPSLWLNSWRGAMEGERERERDEMRYPKFWSLGMDPTGMWAQYI
jgi:hypothetical protein